MGEARTFGKYLMNNCTYPYRHGGATVTVQSGQSLHVFDAACFSAASCGQARKTDPRGDSVTWSGRVETEQPTMT